MNGSSAMGRYQFMPDTLTELRKTLGLKGDEIMSRGLQDRMMRQLLNEVGYDDFLAGRQNLSRTQYRLAGRFDSLAADPSDLSYLRKSGRHKARVGTADIQSTLQAAKRDYDSFVQEHLDEGRLPPAPGGWR